MKTTLFENVGGNQFRLLKENVNKNESLISSGLKKVFGNGDSSISYQRVEAVGLSYIKDINEAKRIALDDAKSIAKSFGYKDVVNEAKFVKENSETDMNNPAEKKEVTLAKQILEHTLGINNILKKHQLGQDGMNIIAHCDFINQSVQELLKMHGQ